MAFNNNLMYSLPSIFSFGDLQLSHKTVVENIAFPLQIKGINTDDSISKAMDMVKLVGLDGRENYFPREL